MKAVIMAGGFGTRISSLYPNVPKPMIDVCNKPILQYQIENLKKYNITDIILVIGYLGDIIKNYFKDGKAFGVNIRYYEEVRPLGTAGAIPFLNLKEDFLILCGDLIFDINFDKLIKYHKSKNALATLVAHPNDHPFDSSLLVTKFEYPFASVPVDTKQVVQWISKEDDRTQYYKNRTNAGIQIVSPILFNNKSGKLDLDRDILKPAISTNRIYVYDTTEYIKDTGTPDRYREVTSDVYIGKVQKKNLSNKQKAVFLDRDGIINKLNGFISKPEDLILNENFISIIKEINKSGCLCVVITNQPVIARGECTFEILQQIHNKMETELGKFGVYVDGIYYCPHHPDKGFVDERPEFKIKCNCRKPNPGLILKAAKELNIDISQSYMIGDSDTDIECGKKAGCLKNIKVNK